MAARALVPRLVLAASLIALPGCKDEPALDVQVADGTTPAPAAGGAAVAPPLGPGAEMPPDHPPIDGAAGGAPPGPIAGHETGTPSLPAGHPPLDGGAASSAIAGTMVPGGEGDQAIAWKPPSTWVATPPSSPMRRAQYRIPGPRGEAECVVFYFGPGQGGDPQANAERWSAQFANADGSKAPLQTRAGKVGGMDVLFVETRGTYQAGAMAGGPVEPKPGHALLGAIVQGPDANWFFKLTGPAATVEAERGAFETMIASMKRGAAPAG